MFSLFFIKEMVVWKKIISNRVLIVSPTDPLKIYYVYSKAKNKGVFELKNCSELLPTPPSNPKFPTIKL